ncbi:uncharacterized protein GGS25DRAFT_275112 [Hypoxylon fragiforme]|uniref:uncharacterized protein n=1 Tax=Hypoxylon fragiforme TaxID=63214 RepID=UPI0020C60BD3|nr:uncharacterized protein GGS25DRAFT_275112 [Hypoxylon fragiforme]KAI2608416.1 hypothetical protein GGS25DRAFT_275112 [Hypoxylon fragiforme]
MLGRFRMTVDDCIHEYETLSGAVFGHSRWIHDMNTVGVYKRCKYSTQKFHDVITEVIMRRVERGQYDRQNARFNTESGLCRVLVIANKKEAEGIVTDVRFFRSYEIYPHPASFHMTFILSDKLQR